MQFVECRRNCWRQSSTGSDIFSVTMHLFSPNSAPIPRKSIVRGRRSFTFIATRQLSYTLSAEFFSIIITTVLQTSGEHCVQCSYSYPKLRAFPGVSFFSIGLFSFLSLVGFHHRKGEGERKRKRGRPFFFFSSLF
jgi:hypothetical protein